MTEYQLERICDSNPNCGCNCMKCNVMAMYQRSQLGLDEYDEEDEDY